MMTEIMMTEEEKKFLSILEKYGLDYSLVEESGHFINDYFVDDSEVEVRYEDDLFIVTTNVTPVFVMRKTGTIGFDSFDFGDAWDYDIRIKPAAKGTLLNHKDLVIEFEDSWGVVEFPPKVLKGFKKSFDKAKALKKVQDDLYPIIKHIKSGKASEEFMNGMVWNFVRIGA